MADAGNPNFSHPPFIAGDYEVVGTNVVIGSTEISFGTFSSDNDFDTFKFPIFNCQHEAKINWNATGNTHWGGSFPINTGFQNIRSSPPYDDYARISIIIAAATGGLSKFRVDYISRSAYYVLTGDHTPAGGYVNMPDDNTGDFEIEMSTGADKGGGLCDVSIRVVNTKHGIDESYTEVDWAPEDYLLDDEWHIRGLGKEFDYGSVHFEEYSLNADVQASIDLNGQGIASQEAIGSPTIVQPGGSPINVFGYEPEFFEGDILMIHDPLAGYADMVLADRDVERDPTFETAILLTLGSDKRVTTEEDIPDDAGYRGGWWGDDVPVVEGDEFGWKGWLLRRSKATEETLAKCKEYLEDGFQWLLDDGVVESMEINVSYGENNKIKEVIKMDFVFTRPGGQDIFYTFFYNWEAQLLKRG